jgi:phosphonatase-like hydrolase
VNIELAIFDLEATVDGAAVDRCIRGLFRQRGIDLQPRELEELRGLEHKEAIRLVLARHTPSASSNVHVERFFAAVLFNLLAHYQFHPEVREAPFASATFERLRAMGIKIALDTSLPRLLADVMLRRLRWSLPGTIDALVAADEVRVGRPSPSMIRRALERTDVLHTSRVMKVAASGADLLQGEAAGCALLVAVASSQAHGEDLRRHPHTHLVGSLAEIPDILARTSGLHPRAVAAVS